MNRQVNSLSGRVGRLERLQRPEVSSFYLIWGRDEADLAIKLDDAKTRGILKRGDKFDARVWTRPDLPPAPRWTRANEMSVDELTIVVAREDRDPNAWRDSSVSRLSSAELSDIYAQHLPLVD